MTLYEAFLFVHVLAAVVWVGGVAMHVALFATAGRAGTSDEAVRLLELDEKLVALYVGSSLAVVGAGVGLVLEGGWDWAEPWVLFGLAVFAAAFLTGLLFFAPEGRRLSAAITAHGRGSAEAVAVARRIETVTRVELALLVAAVLAMTVKPGL